MQPEPMQTPAKRAPLPLTVPLLLCPLQVALAAMDIIDDGPRRAEALRQQQLVAYDIAEAARKRLARHTVALRVRRHWDTAIMRKPAKRRRKSAEHVSINDRPHSGKLTPAQLWIMEN
jgi:hypothetical protein